MNENGDTEKLERKSRWAWRIAIVAAFALALLSAISSFFFWIFFGIAIYFAFLGWYFGSLAAPKQNVYDYQNTPGQNAALPYQEFDAQKLLRFLPILIGFTFIGLVAYVVFSASKNDQNVEAAGNEMVETEKVDSQTIGETISTEANTVLEEGNKFYNEGRYDEAMTSYKRALTLQPDFSAADYNIALIYYVKKEYTLSAELAKKLTDRYPDYAEAFQLAADSYYALKNNEQALVNYEKAYQLGIRTAVVCNYIAYLYDIKNEIEKAITFYEEAIAQDGSLADVYQRLIELNPDKAAEYKKQQAANKN